MFHELRVGSGRRGEVVCRRGKAGGSHDDRGEVGGMTGVGGAGGAMGGMGGLWAGREVSQEVLSQQLLSLLQVLGGVLVIFGVVFRVVVAGDG